MTDNEQLQKMWQDMYTGNGRDNLPMTVRVSKLEDSVAEMVENSKSTRNMMTGTMWTVIGGVIIFLLTHAHIQL